MRQFGAADQRPRIFSVLQGGAVPLMVPFNQKPEKFT
jgi:hypothetical protein